jgi:hypothetical protein
MLCSAEISSALCHHCVASVGAAPIAIGESHLLAGFGDPFDGLADGAEAWHGDLCGTATGVGRGL